MPDPPDGQAAPAAPPAVPDGQDPARKADGRGGLMAKLDDTRLQLANVVVALAALGVAIFAAVSANSAASQANHLAVNVTSAKLHLTPGGLSARFLPGPAKFLVSLNLANAGGGDAQAIKAWLGTLNNIHGVSFVGTCPQPVRSFSFFFPSGTVLGTTGTLFGTAKVPRDDLTQGTPTNSMVLYVYWQNNDGSTQVNCENLSNHSRIGNLAIRPG